MLLGDALRIGAVVANRIGGAVEARRAAVAGAVDAVPELAFRAIGAEQALGMALDLRELLTGGDEAGVVGVDVSGRALVAGRALAALERVAPLAGGNLDGALDALTRAYAELGEATISICAAGHQLEADPSALQDLDERLFEIRQQARKHRCSPSDLPAVHISLAERLAAIEDSADEIGQLVEA
ncbi:MAG: hypothetical protein VW338_11710, partial [Rhodospirillaceae bacterium]